MDEETKVDKPIKKKVKPKIYPKVKSKIKSFFVKTKNLISKVIDSDDLKTSYEFISYILFFGILINFMFVVITSIPLTLGFPAFGIALWFLEKKVVPMLRMVVHK